MITYSAAQLEIMQHAIRHRGERQQCTKAIEEMAELTQVLCKNLIEPWQTARTIGLEECILEEVADATIMLHQLQTIFGRERVQAYVDMKLERLAGNLPLPGRVGGP